MDAREVIVLQLQLLDLVIGKQEVIVPIDASARAGLIDLMARMLMVVFQAEEGRVHDRVAIQSQDQAGALGSQSHRLLTAIQREAGTAE
jgi:hypothetical protein